MKQFILSSLLIGTSLTAAFAQGAVGAARQAAAASSVSANQAGAPAQKGAERKERADAAAKAAGLTEDDRAKLRATRQKRKGEMAAIKNNTELTPEQRKTQVKAKHEEQKAEVDATIGKDKADKLRDYNKANRPKGEGRGKGRGQKDQKNDK